MPLFWLSLAFLAGVVLAQSISLAAPLWLGFAAAMLVLWAVALFVRRRSPPPASRLPGGLPFFFAALLLACLGGYRYQSSLPAVTPQFIAFYNDLESAFVIEGVIVAPPDDRDLFTHLRVETTRLRPENDPVFRPIHGVLLVKAPPGGEWQYGDRLRLEGRLQTPPEDEEFSYRDYLARQGVYSLMPDPAAVQALSGGHGSPALSALYAFKARALETIYRLYPDPEAPLLAGILLGVETGIPETVQAAFTATGASHIVAISGFNMTIIAGLFVTIFGRLLGARKGALAAALGLAAYTLLVGVSPSVVRAALMGGLGLFARQVGARQHGLNSLAFVAALMAAQNPHIPWDVGFQLSFTATLGLILYADPLSRGFSAWLARRLPLPLAQKIAAPVSEYFLFTLAAQLLTLPVTIFHFGRISLISFVVNPLVLPVQPAVMLLGGLSLLLGLIYAPLGQLAAYLAWPFVVFTIRVIELFARVPSGSLALGDVALPVVLVMYAAIFAATLAWERVKRFAGMLWRPAGLAGLAGVVIFTWRGVLSQPDGALKVTVLDVGAGSAVLVQTPSGRALLVGGGESATRLADALGRRLPAGERALDWILIPSPAEDQVTALPPILERYPPGQVFWAGPTHATYAARDLWQALQAAQIPVTLAEAGHRFDLGDGATLRALTVGKRGATLLLEYGQFRMLLPAGVDFEAMAALQNGAAVGPVSALLLADSGYAPSNPPDWIANLRPQLALLSVDAGNRAGLPDAETLQTLRDYALLRTDRNGWITLTTDGAQWWVETGRK